MEQGTTDPKIIKIKDIMRLFFKYDIDALPVLDKKNKFKGIINKNLIIQDATDSEFIGKLFSRVADKYLTYPDEEKFLFLVSNLSEDVEFPVIDEKGKFLFLWDKRKLLNSYYSISDKEKEADKTDELLYKAVLNNIPSNIILTGIDNNIFFANKSFIKDFDFELNILLGRNLNKFFPNINIILAKQNFFPKIHSITYRHIKWHYIIIKCKASFIYIFSKAEESLIKHGKDNIEIEPKRKKKEKQKGSQKDKSLPNLIRDKETDMIKKVLQENDWNITKAAGILNIPRQTLQYKIIKYKIG